jgi:TRAP-type C4-dicarboxylate transport system permease small subunit
MFAAILHRINQAALWLGGLSVLAMTLLGGADILSTYFLGRPIHSTYEATETLMVVIVYLGLGFVHVNRAHICVDVGYDKMNGFFKRISEIVTLALMLLFFTALAWRGWQQAFYSYRIGEYSSGIVAFPIYPARFALSVGATLAILCCIADLIAGGRFRRSPSFAARDRGEMSIG